MSDWDAVIIGGGPAGLTAGLYLCRARWNTLLIERSSYGGYIKNIELIENYPGFSQGVSGAALGTEMVEQAVKYGLQLKRADVNSVQCFPGENWVTSDDGNNITTPVVIFAGGSVHKKLGVPGEESLHGRGVFTCALCDGGEYADRIVAVIGGGDAGVTEALYMSRIASRVILIEAMPQLTATAVLQDRIRATPSIEVRLGVKVEAILGDERVEAVEISHEGRKESLKAGGVLVQIGLDPDTAYLEGIVPLDDRGQVLVNDNMETEIPGIYAAGDIRSGSPRQVVTAVGDGASAGISAQRFLQSLKG
ncbi:MAG: FAD-dependent oxidoreductase [Dehalococcoidales bacterium]|nr:FAD-dependent oxidoreductase [Dehalococcoidales bacterium]